MTDRVISISRDIAAPPETIFDLLADPRKHQLFDGSDMVQGAKASGPDRLSKGATFGMDMKLGPIPYPITNRVVEFEENRRIAWRHLGGHVWRYELEPLEGGGTRVTESFDWRPAKLPWLYPLVGYDKAHVGNITRTLERLEAVVTR